jgi:hypothetical protein
MSGNGLNKLLEAAESGDINQLNKAMKDFANSQANKKQNEDYKQEYRKSLPEHIRRAEEAAENAARNREIREGLQNASMGAEKILSPQGQAILDKHYKLPAAERTKIEKVAITHKITDDWAKEGHSAIPTQDFIDKNSEKFARDPKLSNKKGLSLINLALVDYYLAQEPKQAIAKSGGAYDSLSSDEKKAVSLAAYRSYQHMHERGTIGAIHGNAAQQDFQKFVDSRTPYTNSLGKDNYPAMVEIADAIDLRRLGVKIKPGEFSHDEREKLLDDLKRAGKRPVQINVPADLDKGFHARYEANRKIAPFRGIDEQYEKHKAELIGDLLARPRNPGMADKWITGERDRIAKYELQGAKDDYRRSQGGTPDMEILTGGNDWCKSTEEKTGLPQYFQNRNQVPRCGPQMAKR